MTRSALNTSGRGSRSSAPGPNDAIEVELRFPWWLHPAWAAGLFVAILPIASAPQIRDSFELWGVPRYIEPGLALVGVLSGLAFVCAAVFASGFKHKQLVSVSLTADVVRRLHRIAVGLFIIALFGYVAWFGLSYIRGASAADYLDVIALREGAVGGLKRVSPPVAGVTTLTQLGVVAAGIMMFLRRARAARYTPYLTVLLGLAVIRSFFYGERLALIEVALPLIIIFVVVDSPGRNRSRILGGLHVPKAIVPVVMLPALWAVFALFEYSRSWLYYRNVVDSPFAEYVSTRLLGYYTTTVNNGALYHEILADQQHDPYFSFAFVWDAPFLGSLLGSPNILGASPREWWSSSLENLANPEFNNEGTFLVTDADLGTPLSMIYWAALGLLVGYVYNRARAGDLRFTIAYASLFIGLLEISRINYWTQGRFIPVVVGLLILLVYIGRPVPKALNAQIS